MLLKAVRGLVGMAAIAAITAMGLPSNTYAQESGNYPQKLTLVIGGGLNWNMADGPYTPPGNSTPLPAGFKNQGDYNTPEFHAGLEIPIVNGFMLAPRLSYNDLSSVLDDNASTSQLPLDQTVAYAYRTVGLDILAKINPLGNLHFLVGPSVAEKVKNSYAWGIDNVEAASTSTTEMPGKIDLFASVTGGVGYDIPLTTHNSLWLTPELTYTYPFTNLSGGETGVGDLRVSTVRGALSLKFNLGAEEAAPVPVLADLGASITARGVMPDGSVVGEPVVPQQALHNRASMPLLPYVFFEENQAIIPTRYSRMGATGFSTTSLAGKDAIDANHALLDIVGQRMQSFTTSTIKITGTNSNSGAEKGKIDLSKNRAMAARDYLVNTWKIDAGRITVDQRNLPELPTNPVTKAGQEENRRIEITSNDARVTEPVKVESRDAVSVGETVVRFETSVRPADHPFSSWQIKVDNNGTQIGQTLSGSGAPPAVTTMTLPDAARLINEPLHYTLSVTDNTGRTVNADGMTRVVNRTVDRENLERFAMLSFDFDRAEINPRAKQMLDLIGESVSRDATGVTVSGYCDNTGTDEYNQQLSEARANSAVTALRSITRLPQNTNVRGYGERDPKFSNDLPEGRQLNRRVEFTIEKSSR